MCKDDKIHKIGVACDLIRTVMYDTDTDMDIPASDDLLNALGWLEEWFDEEDI